MATYHVYNAYYRDDAFAFSPLRKAGMTERAFRRIEKGDYISYLLPLSACPTNPNREWHGRVLAIGQDAVMVAVLDEGYVGNTEIVRRGEIVSVGRV